MTKADEAYALLAEMIETGGLKSGAFWTEAGLVEELGLGRTPLREAVQRLDREHLVRIRAGRGIEIPANSVDDQLLRLEVRRSMESLAATLACARASEGELATIGELTDSLKAQVDFMIESFHEVLAPAAVGVGSRNGGAKPADLAERK